MAEIFIYSSLDLREARGNLENDLEDFLEESGSVTGGGGGSRGWNIDLEVDDENLPEHIEKIKLFLSDWGVPPDTDFDVYKIENSIEVSSRYYVFSSREILDWIKTTLTFLYKRENDDNFDKESIKGEILALLSELTPPPEQLRLFE
jgi:hypothetical protein